LTSLHFRSGENKGIAFLVKLCIFYQFTFEGNIQQHTILDTLTIFKMCIVIRDNSKAVRIQCLLL